MVHATQAGFTDNAQRLAIAFSHAEVLHIREQYLQIAARPPSASHLGEMTWMMTCFWHQSTIVNWPATLFGTLPQVCANWREL